ncbi:MAG: HypC/HybG/HupF family hydrogenase formation chaperone [Desulfurococcaceae archaeon]|jgi:hydrogenase expression/formation protein HypC
MCLGTPAVILEVDYDKMTAKVDYGDGVPRSVLIGISSDRVNKGDIVIVHAGVIVSKMSEEDVLEQVKFFEEVLGQDAPSFTSIYELLLEKSKLLRQGEV